MLRTKLCGMLLVGVVFGAQIVCAQPIDSKGVNPHPIPDIRYKKQSLYGDFFDNHLFDRLEQYFMFSKNIDLVCRRERQSLRVNRFDEVPDSYLFTNRNGKKKMTAEELRNGSNENGGPDMSRPWTILKAKSDGVSPGFFIKDARGDKYLIKVDSKQYPEMASATEVIASKFYYAFGYNVPQYTICYFLPSLLTVADSATYYAEDGFKREFTLAKAHEFLEELGYCGEDGKYRAVASKIVEGESKGYVSFRSSRSEDMFDAVSHEHRREIRALRVFSSWMNNHDIRRGNSLDMLIDTDAGWYLKHYIIDFGSCFGSHTIHPKWAEAGHTYVISPIEAIKSWVSLGLYSRPYYCNPQSVSAGLGYLTNDFFHPQKWKPMIPNFAFDNMTRRDAYWATKIVMSFTDEQIDALVATGHYSQKSDEDYLAQFIKDRRDMIGAYWFTQVNPLDDFSLAQRDGSLILGFKNLYTEYGFDEVDELRYEVSVYSGNTLLETYESRSTECVIPMNVVRGVKDIVITIKTLGTYKKWRKEVYLFLDDSLKISGISRE